MECWCVPYLDSLAAGVLLGLRHLPVDVHPLPHACEVACRGQAGREAGCADGAELDQAVHRLPLYQTLSLSALGVLLLLLAKLLQLLVDLLRRLLGRWATAWAVVPGVDWVLLLI